ncbi:MAG TPA: tRNA pseudouridine(55) synthase TruB [Thermomicrobiaceae bacterium]|nr:tRNA pseudouridine(55) synthase TruB [Thermomicrobiaceae bacterium]HEX5396051.1 tRNA pseudouridine(55) synthase TruB [Candidatus Limnocylindria bacterium]
MPLPLHGILVCDKPRGPSSHDLVARVRRLLGTRRVGHAGTLDPAAEGVLLIAVGRATKLIESLQAGRKEYAARLVLGQVSTSGDLEGPLLASPEHTAPDAAEIRAALDSFRGEIEQVPPAHSAIKVAGQPLYRSARRGEVVTVPSRRVTIYGLNLLDYHYPELDIVVECSSGTYIRTLASDLGAALGTGAYLHALVRTCVGRFGLAEAWTLDELERRLSPASFSGMALHPDDALPERQTLLLDSAQTGAWYDGRPVRRTGTAGTAARCGSFNAGGRWLGVGALDSTADQWLPRLVVGSS